MRLSSQLRQHSQQPKSRLEMLLKEDLKDSSRGFSPQANRLNFHRHQKLTPYHFSGPQISQSKIIHMHNERQQNVSALIDEKKPSYSEYNHSKRQKDSNVAYIQQIDGISHKKRARYYFKKQREAIQEVYQIGVLTSQGIEQYKLEEEQINKFTQQATSQQKLEHHELDIEQLHFEMVRTQQRFKNIITQ